MIIKLELIKEELKVDILGIPAEFKKIPAQLIDFMIKEAGQNTKEAIRSIEGYILRLNKIDNNDSKEECFQAVYPEETKEGINMPPQKAINAQEDDSRMLDKAGDYNTASKSQGPLPSAQQTSPVEGVAKEPATAAGRDKEGVQSVSMASSGQHKMTLHRSRRQWRRNVINCGKLYHQCSKTTGRCKASNHLQRGPSISTVISTIEAAIRAIYVWG
jgi:hypothetical protein